MNGHDRLEDDPHGYARETGRRWRSRACLIGAALIKWWPSDNAHDSTAGSDALADTLSVPPDGERHRPHCAPGRAPKLLHAGRAPPTSRHATSPSRDALRRWRPAWSAAAWRRLRGVRGRSHRSCRRNDTAHVDADRARSRSRDQATSATRTSTSGRDVRPREAGWRLADYDGGVELEQPLAR